MKSNTLAINNYINPIKSFGKSGRILFCYYYYESDQYQIGFTELFNNDETPLNNKVISTDRSLCRKNYINNGQ